MAKIVISAVTSLTVVASTRKVHEPAQLRTCPNLFVRAAAACSACAVVAVADMAVTVGATVVKTTVKAAGAVVDAITPESKNAKQ